MHTAALSESHSPSLRTWSGAGLGLALAAIVLLAVRLLTLGDVTTALANFNAELPAMTLFVLGLPAMLCLAVTIAAAMALLWKERRLRDKGLSLLINTGAAVLAVAAWAVVQYALALPMYRFLPFAT